MTTRRRALLANGLCALGGLAAPAIARAQDSTLRDLARRATIHLFPVYEMYRMRWRATVDETNPLRQRLNRFRHIPQLADHRWRMGTTPNNDIFYSSAWLDLSLEPMFLTVPPVGHLYYSYALTDLFANTFASVSHRLQGGEPPTQMIVGPGWTGDASSEVTLLRAPTNSVWLLGRILIDGPEEIDRVRILQGRALLETPDMRNERRILETGELMHRRTVLPPDPVADWPAPHPGDPFDLFEASLRALGESPLSERDRAAFESFAALRLRPGRKFDLRAFSEAERHSLLAGIEQGRTEIRAAGSRYGRTIDGWTYPERAARTGDDDPLYRAPLYRAQAALNGLAVLEPADSIAITCNADSAGRPLSGANAYRLTFPADGLPPAHAFWSLAMYEVTPEGRAFFIDNPLARYSIGDRTPGLQKAADGSLTLYLQRERPTETRDGVRDGAPAANWLPAPAGPMRLVLRAYEPGAALLEGRYRAPGVQRNSPS